MIGAWTPFGSITAYMFTEWHGLTRDNIVQRNPGNTGNLIVNFGNL